MLKVCLTLAALCLLRASAAEQLVPLLAWSNSDVLSAVERPSSTSSLVQGVNIEHIDIVVLLKSSSLSFDDIAKHGGVYGEKNAPLSSLQDFLSSSVSSISMGLKGQPASELTSALSFAMDVSPHFVTHIDSLENKGRELFVVEMPQGNDEETFRAHDALITKIASMLDVQNVHYVMIYTADHVVDQVPQELAFNVDYVRSADPLGVNKGSQNDTKNLCYPLWNVDNEEQCSSSSENNTCKACLLFCADSTITFTRKFENKTFIAVTNGSDSFTKIDGSCNTTAASGYPDFYNRSAEFGFIAFNVTFNSVNVSGNDLDPDEVIYQVLVYTFVKGECGSNRSLSNLTSACGFWTMNVFAGNSTEEVELYDQYHSERIYSPFAVPLNSKQESDISYACGNNSLNRFIRYPKDNSSHDYTYFQHTNLQVQPFSSLKVSTTSQTLHFGSAYNCQGYFSMASLMGVVSILILLVILYLSSVFIFSIQSIDRFDDPKGETINVENLH